MKKFGFNGDATHQAIIYECDTEAHEDADMGRSSNGFTAGMVVGTSEWAWVSDDDGRRICAALTYFSETSTVDLERLVAEMEDS